MRLFFENKTDYVENKIHYIEDFIFYASDFISDINSIAVFLIKLENSYRNNQRVNFLKSPRFKHKYTNLYNRPEFSNENILYSDDGISLKIKVNYISSIEANLGIKITDLGNGRVYEDYTVEVPIGEIALNYDLYIDRLKAQVRIEDLQNAHNGDYCVFHIVPVKISVITNFISTDDLALYYDDVDIKFLFNHRLYNELKEHEENCLFVNYISHGTFLRPSLLNEFVLNVNEDINNKIYFIDAERSVIKMKKHFLMMSNKIIYVQEQSIKLTPLILPIKYSLLIFYVDNNYNLRFDTIVEAQDNLIDCLRTFNIPERLKANIKYPLFYAVVNNTPIKTYQIAIFDARIGDFGSENSSANIIKTKIESCDNYKEIEFLSEYPIVQFYDNDGKMFVPENIQYDFNESKLKITIGASICYTIVLI